MGDIGPGPALESSGNSAQSEPERTKNDTVNDSDDRLQLVVQRWPDLPEGAREQIMVVVRGAGR
jgi:hypothetical protein